MKTFAAKLITRILVNFRIFNNKIDCNESDTRIHSRKLKILPFHQKRDKIVYIHYENL